MVACHSGPKCVRIRAVSAPLFEATELCAQKVCTPPRSQRTESSSKRSWQPVIHVEHAEAGDGQGQRCIPLGGRGRHAPRAAARQLGTLDRSGAVRWPRSHVHLAFRALKHATHASSLRWVRSPLCAPRASCGSGVGSPVCFRTSHAPTHSHTMHDVRMISALRCVIPGFSAASSV